MEKITQEEIIASLEEKFAKEVSMSSDLEYDIGMDSLDKVEFIYNLADRLGFELAEENESDFRTVQDVWDWIQARQGDTIDKGE